MEDIISLAKRRGFIYPGSDIYGGLAGTWDYGPMGVALKNNIKNLWWRMFVDMRDDMYGVDAAILMNPKVWEASGHVAGFSDLMVECKKCHTRHRVDKLVEDTTGKAIEKSFHEYITAWGNELIVKLKAETAQLKEHKINLQKESLVLDKELADLKIQLIDAGFDLDEIKPDTKKVTYVELNKYNTLNAESAAFKKITEGGISAYLEYLIDSKNIPCTTKNCGSKDFTHPANFNLMFKTNIGATETPPAISYLRPETAGGMFANFKSILDSLHPKLPFGLAQMGKAFRNEIAPRDFVFRSREFEQMEVEYFIHPSQWEQAFDEWRQIMQAWLSAVGIDTSKVVEHEIADGDRAHYSKRTIDFEFEYPFGLKELYGLAYRTDFDLSAHSSGSKVDLSYFDEETKERFVPHVIEPSLGVERTILAVLVSAYHEEGEGDAKRIVLKLPAHIAPIKAAVSPLLKNKPELVAKAREVYGNLKLSIPQIMWDDNGNIGKRYRRQDEIGTPWCITIDFDTLENDTVTVRNRDTMQQERIAISDLLAKITS